MKSATRSLSIKANPQAALAVRTSIDRSQAKEGSIFATQQSP